MIYRHHPQSYHSPGTQLDAIPLQTLYHQKKTIRQNSYQPSTIDQTPIENTTSHVHNENIPFLHPIYLNRDASARRMYTHTYILYQHTPYNNPTSGQHRYISLLNYSPPVHQICTVPHIPLRRAFLFSPKNHLSPI